MNYFDKFPTIMYNGKVAKNLVAKARFTDDTKNNKFLYYPYTVNDGARADNLSQQYYDGPGYSWLIWMTNNIIDPYYQMPLSEEQFTSYIENKYGSLAAANRGIKCWRNNWFSDSSVLSVSQFNSLNSSEKKYYDPMINNYLEVSTYKRRVDNSILSTNLVAEVYCGGSLFTPGEEVYTSSGYGVVNVSDDTSTVINSVIGSIGVGQIIRGRTSNTFNTITQYNVLSTTEAFSHSTYWVPVSYYQYETDLNEGRKHIKLLDNRYKHQVELELERVMQS